MVKPGREDIRRYRDGALTITNGGSYRKGPNSSPVLARNPTRSLGRYCIRLSRVFTRTVSSAMVCLVRFASALFRCDHTDSTGLSACADGGSRETVSQGRAASRSAIAALTWVFR